MVAVTGTNGKTTTTRLLAHIGMTMAGRWRSSTDGVLAQGVLVEPGTTWPGGGAHGARHPGVELGILETGARRNAPQGLGA